MQAFGQLLLFVAFFVTLVTGLTAYYGAITRNAAVVRGARHGIYALAFLYLAMALVLWHGYFSHDYTNKYIATYSDNGMPLIYLFTSFWGGEKGALLFWTTVLTVFSAIAVHQARDRDVAYLGWAAGILMTAVFFFDILMLFASSPFETFITHSGPKDGSGLNPLLQNPTMAIHPPSLLTGYIAFTLPFAFGAASLITGRLDDQWAKDTRKWTIVSWLFLTVGLVLGGLWAYEELGWGGFWMWDPVENAGLIPWFTATAFLHSIVIQERRGMLRRWNFTLVCLTFLLTIFGTFLTRSQLIVSIHAFADSKLADYFLVYMFIIFAVSLGLLTWRWKDLKAPQRIESFLSREAFFVLNNVVLVMCAFVVMWGTLYSKISGAEGFQDIYNGGVRLINLLGFGLEEVHQAQELGEPWFNRIMVPFGVILLFLTAVGPLIAWRRTTAKSFNKVFIRPLVLSTVPMILGTLALAAYRSHAFAEMLSVEFVEGYSRWAASLATWDIYAFFTIWFALFVFAGVGVEFWRGGRIRQRRKGGSLVSNIANLTVKAKRRYGGYIIHVGMAMAFVGFAGSALKDVAPETPLHPGDSVKCGKYKMTYASMNDGFSEGNGYVATKASLVVLRPGETVPQSEVDRVADFLTEAGHTPFQIETKPDSAKIVVKFANRRDRARVREAIYITGVMPKRFIIQKEEPKENRIWFTFKDQKMIQVFPPLIKKQINDIRRVLGSLATGQATVQTTPGRASFSVTWGNQVDYDRVRELMRSEPVLDDIILSRVNPTEDALELITGATGYILWPEVRRYAKQGTPTTEVAIWSRPWEDVYVAMRPNLHQPFVQLIAVVNPLIQLLWIGTIVMFLGGVFLLLPTGLFVPRARQVELAATNVQPEGTAAE